MATGTLSDREQKTNNHSTKRYPEALLEISVRVAEGTAPPVSQIGSSEDAELIIRPLLQYKDREHFIAVHLNQKNKVLAIETISIGSLAAAIVHPRETFKGAFLYGSASIIVAHNHPGGDPTPSREDTEVTLKLRTVSDFIGIKLLDHIIIGRDSYFSFANNGLLDGAKPDWARPAWRHAEKIRRREIKQNVRRIRRKLELTPKQANAIFCRKEDDDFYSFESGHMEPGPATIKLLTLLDNHPELLNEIREI